VCVCVWGGCTVWAGTYMQQACSITAYTLLSESVGKLRVDVSCIQHIPSAWVDVSCSAAPPSRRFVRTLEVCFPSLPLRDR
jgi:hypothetical protein